MAVRVYIRIFITSFSPEPQNVFYHSTACLETDALPTVVEPFCYRALLYSHPLSLICDQLVVIDSLSQSAHLPSSCIVVVMVVLLAVLSHCHSNGAPDITKDTMRDDATRDSFNFLAHFCLLILIIVVNIIISFL